MKGLRSSKFLPFLPARSPTNLTMKKFSVNYQKFAYHFIVVSWILQMVQFRFIYGRHIVNFRARDYVICEQWRFLTFRPKVKKFVGGKYTGHLKILQSYYL